MSAVLAFVRLGRPLFLGGGFVLYAIGAAVARLHGHPLDWQRYAFGQAAVTAFQLMTHYANDYFDYEADCANPTPTRWSGGSRVLVKGELPRQVALVAAIAFAVIGLGFTVIAARVSQAWTAPILVAILVLAWEYSAPPLRLCATGLGELDTAIVVTGLVPVLGLAVQQPDFAGLTTLIVALVPVFLLQLALLFAIEFPDATGDAAAGKRTLVVRLGAGRAAQAYVTLIAIAFSWLPVGYALGLPARVALLAALPTPIAIWRIARVAEHRMTNAFERLTFFAVLLMVTTALGELVGFATL